MVVIQDASTRYEQIYYICKIYDLINGIDEHKQTEMKNTNFLSRKINLNCEINKRASLLRFPTRIQPIATIGMREELPIVVGCKICSADLC